MTTQLNQNEPDNLFPLSPDEQIARHVQHLTESRNKLIQLDQFKGFKECLENIKVRKQFNVAIKELKGPFVSIQNVLNAGYAIQLMEQVRLDPRKHPVEFFKKEVNAIFKSLEVPFFLARVLEQQKHLNSLGEIGTLTGDATRIQDLEKIEKKEAYETLGRLRSLYQGAKVNAALRQLESAGVCTLGRKKGEA